MCEALVRVLAKPDIAQAVADKFTHPGDVVVVCEDGWPWGSEELSHPEYRVVKAPGLSVAALAHLAQPLAALNGEVLYERPKGFDSESLIVPILLRRASPVRVSKAMMIEMVTRQVDKSIGVIG